MKKVLLLLILFASSHLLTFGQINKGSILLGGNFSGYSFKNSSAVGYAGKNRGLSITPVFGKAVRENLVVGASIGYISALTVYSDFNSTSYKTKTYNSSFFLRKYHQLKKSDFYLFAQGELKGSIYKQRLNNSPNSSQTINTSSLSLSLSPGLAYAVSRKFHVEMGLGELAGISYQHDINKYYGAIPTKTVGNGFSFNTALNNSIQAYIGFRIVLAK